MYGDEYVAPPAQVSLPQLRRALELAEEMRQRAADGAEPYLYFREVEGMRSFQGAVVVRCGVYRGGGDDVAELLLDNDGNVMVEDPAPTRE